MVHVSHDKHEARVEAENGERRGQEEAEKDREVGDHDPRPSQEGERRRSRLLPIFLPIRTSRPRAGMGGDQFEETKAINSEVLARETL
ncbi:hypothetical protein L596_020165 [Steinernema carpocapsae]|uniref:Uncharacterized protein n=1 Tax=Steinernema carpocapsae TaxID=34508 RepID=A0A4U5MSR2_STECR|nr:hypothetical protein L596_020165 [Steinernema carpocapsae]